MSRFDRKNYFYADLPAGYQISQFEHPIVGAGTVSIELADGTARQIGVTRLHLEQDAGKSLHDQDPARSFIDLNRAGVALMEIVSEPDLRSPEEAGLYLRKLRTILRYLGTCDGNMEEGSMRADVNVSVRHARRAVPHPLRDQERELGALRHARDRGRGAPPGGAVGVGRRRCMQETRLYDPARGETRSMRSKEDAHDYRYFPDPDLLPLVLDEDWVAELKRATCRNCRTRSGHRFVRRATACRRTTPACWWPTRRPRTFFETVAARAGRPPGRQLDHRRPVRRPEPHRPHDRRQSPVSGRRAGRAARPAGRQRTINGRIAKEVFEAMVETGRGASRDRRKSPGPAPGHRHRGDRCGRRRRARRQPGQARRIPRRQGQAVRLLRRPGHEAHGRQGQSGSGQRRLASQDLARKARSSAPGPRWGLRPQTPSN